MSDKAWLRCEVSPGVFKDESAVEIKTYDSGVVSFFLPTDSVQGDSINVDVVAKNGSFCVVALPKRSFEGSNVARVPMNSVRFA
jgi:hypothetical protein